MSSDLFCIVVNRGKRRVRWSRWGALSLERDLLQGRKQFLRYVEALDPLRKATLEPWMCGLAIVDLDRRILSRWLHGRTPLWNEAMDALLQVRWPGWQIDRIADFVGVPEAVLRQPTPVSLEDQLAWQVEIWRKAIEDPSVQQWRNKDGDAMVREALEWGEYRLWVSLRDREGEWIHDAWEGGYPCGAALMIGREGVERCLALRAACSEVPLAWDVRFDAGALIDSHANTLTIWQTTPAHPEDLLGALGSTWPGWAISTCEGPRTHLRSLAAPLGWR